jgi:hypothetical protein
MTSSTVAAGDNATTNFYISLHLWAQFQTATAPTPWLYGPEAVLSTITLAGLVLNGAVIYITVRDE